LNVVNEGGENFNYHKKLIVIKIKFKKRRKKMRKISSLLIVLFTILLIMSVSFRVFAGTPIYRYNSPEDKYGGTIVITDHTDPKNIDPNRATGFRNMHVATQVFDSLLDYEPGTYNIMPWLANYWDISNDGLVYTFGVKTKGVKFHNGRELTVDDYVFSLNRAKEKRFENSAMLSLVKEIKSVDDNTLQIILEKQDPALLSKLCGIRAAAIMPKEEVEKWGEDWCTKPEATIGTGPFVLNKWDSGISITMEANEEYFLGRPYVDQVVYKVIKDPDTMVMEIEAGNVTFARLTSRPEQLRLLKDPKWVPYIENKPYPNMYWWFINPNVEPFDDIKVRKAVMHAVDIDQAVKIAQKDTALVAHGFVPIGMDCYNPDINHPPHDIDKAKDLLKEAGYPNGFKTKFLCWTWPPQIKVHEIFQQQLKQVGIDAEIEIVDFGTYIDEGAKGEYPIFAYSEGFLNPFAPEPLYRFFHSDNKGIGGNYIFWENEEFDQLISQALTELDVEKRCKLVTKAQEIMLDEAVSINAFTINIFVISQPWFHGLEGKLVGNNGMYHSIKLHRAWLDPDYR
jgi:ABC-type transport system substrate-binding protein